MSATPPSVTQWRPNSSKTSFLLFLSRIWIALEVLIIVIFLHFSTAILNPRLSSQPCPVMQSNSVKLMNNSGERAIWFNKETVLIF